MGNLFLSYFCLVASSLYAGALETCIAKLNELSSDPALRTPFVDAIASTQLMNVSAGKYAELPTSEFLSKKITKPLRRLVRDSKNLNTSWPAYRIKAHKDDEELARNPNQLVSFLHSLDTFVTSVIVDAGAKLDQPPIKDHRDLFIREESDNIWGQVIGRRRIIKGFHKHPYDPTDFEYSFSPNWTGSLFERKGLKPFKIEPGNIGLFRPLTNHGSPWRPLFLNRVFVYGRLKQ